jgi:hypothetical protein
VVGGLSFIVSLVLAEIAAAFPTAGGIYFWSYRLGGEKWGPFLSWMVSTYPQLFNLSINWHRLRGGIGLVRLVDADMLPCANLVV